MNSYLAQVKELLDQHIFYLNYRVYYAEGHLIALREHPVYEAFIDPMYAFGYTMSVKRYPQFFVAIEMPYPEMYSKHVLADMLYKEILAKGITR